MKCSKKGLLTQPQGFGMKEKNERRKMLNSVVLCCIVLYLLR